MTLGLLVGLCFTRERRAHFGKKMECGLFHIQTPVQDMEVSINGGYPYKLSIWGYPHGYGNPHISYHHSIMRGKGHLSQISHHGWPDTLRLPTKCHRICVDHFPVACSWSHILAFLFDCTHTFQDLLLGSIPTSLWITQSGLQFLCWKTHKVVPLKPHISADNMSPVRPVRPVRVR